MTRLDVDESSQLTGCSLAFAFFVVEVILNFCLLKVASDKLPVSISLLFSCVMVVGGPPGFLLSLDRMRVPHAIQHGVLLALMALVALRCSPPTSKHTVVLTRH